MRATEQQRDEWRAAWEEATDGSEYAEWIEDRLAELTHENDQLATENTALDASLGTRDAANRSLSEKLLSLESLLSAVLRRTSTGLDGERYDGTSHIGKDLFALIKENVQ